MCVFVCVCVREAKQSAQRKRSYGSPLVSIVEGEEAECREVLEPDAAERSTTPHSTTDKTEVHRMTVCWGTELIYTACVLLLLLNIYPQSIEVTLSCLFKGDLLCFWGFSLSHIVLYSISPCACKSSAE